MGGIHVLLEAVLRDGGCDMVQEETQLAIPSYDWEVRRRQEHRALFQEECLQVRSP